MSKLPSVSATQPKSTDLEEAQMPTEPSHDTSLFYKLPDTVESMRSGWLSTIGSAATVSSLLAAVEASLVAFFNDKENYNTPLPKIQLTILTLTLAAIILSISATISALALTDEFGVITSRASRNPIHTSSNPTKNVQHTGLAILRYFGARRSTEWIVWYWLICLLLAGLCAVVSIIIYAATQGGWVLIFICLAGGTTLPPIVYLCTPS